MSSRTGRNIQRYAATTRINHWIVAISFVLLALSGLSLFHPAFFWLTNLFGGGPWTRILHPFIGVGMVAAFALLAREMWQDNTWQPRDSIWLRKIKDVINNREENLPEVGRYNAGQKLMYIAQTVSVAVLLVTGLVIWRLYFSGFFPVGLIRLSVVLHALAAFVLVCAVITHIAAGLWVKGSVGAMTRGTVTLGWAWKHHRAWFREMIRPTGGR